MTEPVQIGDCQLWLGNCLDILPTLGKVDAVVTDPPYGVGLGTRKNNNRDRMAYSQFDDTPDYISGVAVPAVGAALALADRGLITPGVRNMWSYPAPKHVGSIYYPAGAGCNSWGFSCWQPMFYYGDDPYGGFGSLHDSFQSTEQAEQNGHPCPKPIKQMVWMVRRASRDGDTILDPFMGSGTTGVACAKLGRRFVGIEIEPRYFDIACKRIEEAYREPDFFVDRPKPAKQEAMDLG